MNGKEASKLIASLKGNKKDFAIKFKRIIENVLEELRDKNLLSLEFAKRHSNFSNILEDHSMHACMFEPWHKYIERLMGYFLERYNYIKPFNVATDGIKLRE